MSDTVCCGGELNMRAERRKSVLLVCTIDDKVSVEVRAEAERKIGLLEEKLRESGFTVATFRSMPNLAREALECTHAVQLAIMSDVTIALWDDGLPSFGASFAYEVSLYGPGLKERCILCIPRSRIVKKTGYNSMGSHLLYDSFDEIVEYVRNF